MSEIPVSSEAIDAALAEIKRIAEDLTEGEVDHLRVGDETPQRCVIRRAISIALGVEGLRVERKARPDGAPSPWTPEQRLVGKWRDVDDEPIHDEGLRIENKNSWGGR